MAISFKGYSYTLRAFILGCMVSFPALGFGQGGQAIKQELSEKIAVLKMLSQQTKANYDKIQTWTGTYNCREQTQIDGDAANALWNISPSTDQLPLTSMCSATIRFAVDVAGDSLFTAFEADGPSEVKLRTGQLVEIPNLIATNQMSPHVIATNQMSIVTPEHYLNFMPTVSHAASRDGPRVALEGGVGRMAFRDPPEKGRAALWGGAIVDPRLFFGFERPLIYAWLGGFCNFFPKANSEEKKELDNSLDVKEERSGNSPVYTIVFRQAQEKEIKLDGGVGFNLVKFCVRERDGTLRWQQTWEYRELEDIYIPAKIRLEKYGDDGNTVFDRTFVLKECSVNKPIAPTVFTYDQFGLENGERVLDRIEDALFVYQDDKLIPATGK